MIRAVVFDFGRVITAQRPESLFLRYEGDLGIPPGSINTRMFESAAWQDAILGRRTEEEFWRTIGPALGLESENAVHAFRRRYRADEATNPEVLELIRHLHGRFRLAVLSNSPPGLARWLEEWNLLDLFDVVFCSGDEGVAKPDPAAYRMTLARLGVKPGEAVFIDDTPENVESARSLGIRSVLFTRYAALAVELKGLIDPTLLGI